VAATTVRLPDDLDERLSRYCATTGAVKNRVVALALREYLEDEPAPRVVLTPREPASLKAAAEDS
jgi:predicted transcriptional regulator